MKLSAILFSSALTPSLITSAGIDTVSLLFLLGIASVCAAVVYSAVTESY